MDPREAPTRWGIVGTGDIAHTFAAALRDVPGARVVAVSSRAQARADAFAREIGAARGHQGVGALAADEEVDVAYVATPHVRHAADTIALLEGGRHVLCEKPLAVSAAEGEAMQAAADRAGRFLMEALWTRFLPATQRFLEAAGEGAVGDTTLLRADLSKVMGVAPTHRLRAAELAGGALLDLGVYLASVAQWWMGEPEQVEGTWTPDPETGVDASFAVSLARHDRVASLTGGFTFEGPRDVQLAGEAGVLRLGPDWHKTGAALHRTRDGEREALTALDPGLGYGHEAREVQACLAEGAAESPRHPVADSLAVLRTLDRLRAAWGLRYPFERDD